MSVQRLVGQKHDVSGLDVAVHVARAVEILQAVSNV